MSEEKTEPKVEEAEAGEVEKTDENEENTKNKLNASTAFTIFSLVIIWVLLGIVALVYSLICFGYSGTTFQKTLGLIVAFITGPFYFIYYKYSPNYCKPRGGRSCGGKRKK